MKLTFTTLFALIVGVAAGQTNPTKWTIGEATTDDYVSKFKLTGTMTNISSFAFGAFPQEETYKPIDTVKCYMFLSDPTSGVMGWQRLYVIIKNGTLDSKGGYIHWFRKYYNMAIGPFENVFLAPNRKDRITDDVLQIWIK